MKWALPALLVLPAVALGQDMPDVGVTAMTALSGAEEAEVSAAVRLVVLLTALSLLPAVLLMMTPFTRFVIVLAMLRQALGLQQTPPNQVIIGLSLLLGMVVMQPTLSQVDETALQPYLAGEIGHAEAWNKAMDPMRTFMLRNTDRDDLRTAMRISRISRPDTLNEVPTTVVLTAFVLSELRTAFTIAVKVYIPFLVVDLVVASILLGMGMMMLPPVVISLPFKLLVFVLMDGWGLLITGLAAGVV